MPRSCSLRQTVITISVILYRLFTIGERSLDVEQGSLLVLYELPFTYAQCTVDNILEYCVTRLERLYSSVSFALNRNKAYGRTPHCGISNSRRNDVPVPVAGRQSVPYTACIPGIGLVGTLVPVIMDSTLISRWLLQNNNLFLYFIIFTMHKFALKIDKIPK